MKILHTSDWHLGRSLYGIKRYDEFTSFLEWLSETIKKEQIEVLLVAGDIFDNTTPGSRTQELYYKFLCRIAGGNCSHIVIIAGNHDSPSFLDAPKELLKVINVHVVGNIKENIEDEVFLLDDENGEPGIIVGAVPYLRDRDVRTPEAGESYTDKNKKLIKGVSEHYCRIGKKATEMKSTIKADINKNIPVIAMGHLFTQGGKTVDGDGVRELYVGTLAHVDINNFSEPFDYIALGHLHIPQKVAHKDNIRYSGSPLPIGFGEAKQQKKVVIADFAAGENSEVKISEINVPCFQKLELISGDIVEIENRIDELKKENESVYLEIQYTGDKVVANLKEKIDGLTAGTKLEVLRIKNRQVINVVLDRSVSKESLDELNEEQVFQHCLDANNIPEEQRKELHPLFSEVMQRITSNEGE